MNGSWTVAVSHVQLACPPTVRYTSPIMQGTCVVGERHPSVP